MDNDKRFRAANRNHQDKDEQNDKGEVTQQVKNKRVSEFTVLYFGFDMLYGVKFATCSTTVHHGFCRHVSLHHIRTSASAAG